MSRTHHPIDNWTKSSYSGGDGGNCVELGSTGTVIAFRDTKDADMPADVRPVLIVGRDAGDAFLASIRKTTGEMS